MTSWKAYLEPLGRGTSDSRRRRRSIRDMLEYRLFFLENMLGAFDINDASVNLANTHRNQSRTLWNQKNMPREDRAAWGDNEVFDMLRVERVDREMQIARLSGNALRAALRNAANNESLRQHVCQKLDAAGVESPSNPQEARPAAMGVVAGRGGGLLLLFSSILYPVSGA
jgi:hypothetical protein